MSPNPGPKPAPPVVKKIAAIGRIVRFVRNGVQYPFVITAVRAEFIDGVLMGAAGKDAALMPCELQENIQHSNDGNPQEGRWHWPPHIV